MAIAALQEVAGVVEVVGAVVIGMEDAGGTVVLGVHLGEMKENEGVVLVCLFL